MSRRDELTPKFHGIYDKAQTGKSPKAAIHCVCLGCQSCKTKEIRDCLDEGCPVWLYRPYQKIPHKFRTQQIRRNLNRVDTGQIVGESKKSDRRVAKDVLIKNAPEGLLRVHIEIEPKAT